MGALWLALLYAVTALAVGFLGRRWSRRHRSQRRPSRRIVVALAVAPLLFTAAGFLPGKTLAPTASLAGVPPWADPELVERSRVASMDANPLLLDPLSQMIPWARAARGDLLFNPHQGSGAALLGNGQSAVLFPTEVASRLLPPFRAVTYSQAARLLIALWGLFLVARRLALGEGAALVAAVLFAGSGFVQLWRLHPHSLVAAMLPWILAAALDLVRRPGWIPARRLAWAGALGVFAGHPETLLHGVLLVLSIALLLAKWRCGLAILRWGAVAAGLSLLLAAPVLLPMVETLQVSVEWQQGRGERQVQTGGSWGDTVDRLEPALALGAHGDPRGGDWRGDWRGPENLIEVGGAAVGAPALLLAFLALGLRRRRRVSVGLGAVGVLALFAGALAPPLTASLGAVPLLGDSLLKRLSLGWCLVVPLLAALAFEERRRLRRPAVVGAALLLAGGVAAAVWDQPVPSRLFYLLPLLVAALGLGVAGLARWRSSASWPAVATAAVLAALLLPRSLLFASWVPVASADAFYPETLGIREVQARLAAAPPVGYRVAGLDSALVPQAAVFYGLEEARSYDPMELGLYRTFSAALGEVGRTGWVRILDPDRPALDFLGVRYLFDHPSMVQRPGVEVIYQGRDTVIYENPGALPRLFVPRRLRAAVSSDEALEMAVGLADFAALAVVEGLGLEEGGNGRGEVRDLVVAGRRVSAEVVAEEALVVASSQPAIPGWRLFLGGEEVEARRINGAFLGVDVPAGRHRLEMIYQPRSWDFGRLAGGFGLVLLGLASWRWR